MNIPWPDPNAPRSEVDAFLASQAPAAPPAPFGLAENGQPHEAPAVTNGPSILCSGCEVVRVGILGPPFCRACRAQMVPAGAMP